MAPAKPSPAKRTEAEPVRPTFKYEQVVGEFGCPGGGNAAVLAAQQAGCVITGEPVRDSAVEVDGGTLVVWRVPIERTA